MAKRIISIIIFLLMVLGLSCGSLFSMNQPLIRNLDDKKTSSQSLDYLGIIYDVFNSFYGNCFKDLERLNYSNYNIKTPYKYPVLLKHIGFSLNGIEDEIECVNSFDNSTFFVIGILTFNNFTNRDDNVLLDFLNIQQYCMGACVTSDCLVPIQNLARRVENFKYTDVPEDKKYEDVEIVRKESTDEEYVLFFVCVLIFISYLIIKIIIGIIRIIYIPKGYDIYAAKLIQEKSHDLNQIDKLNQQSKGELSSSLTSESSLSKYVPNKEYLPLYLRIFRFLDFFDDFRLLITVKNLYYNDNGLEVINFIKCIVLFFYIFSTTFTSLFALPSKDILNRNFFFSSGLFLYRLTSNAQIFWIFLEATCGAYKLMQFVNNNKKRNDKNFNINLIFIFGKFLLLFIPKIIIFILFYFIFYQNIIKFRIFFDAEVTFKYIVKKVITKNIKCKFGSGILANFNMFSIDANNLNKCYDFTFLYNNILLCIIICMILLYIIIYFKQEIIEHIFMIFNLVFFFGLMLIIKDDELNYKRIKDGKQKDRIYNFYHFRGQEYSNKIIYLFFAIYYFGFIFGILMFNYDNLKRGWILEKQKKNKENKRDLLKDMVNNNNEEEISNKKIRSFTGFSLSNSINKNGEQSISNKQKYIPFSYFDWLLKFVNNMKLRTKVILIIIDICALSIVSGFFRIYAYFTNQHSDDKNGDENKYDEDYDSNNVLEMKFDKTLKGYFLFERHFSLIFFFFFCLLLSSIPKKGTFRKLIKSKIVTSISRVGFTFFCLCYILSNLSFCGFLIKIKFSLSTFFIISLGNFLIIFVVCAMITITMDLPLRILIKKLVRQYSNSDFGRSYSQM